jgi:hypothetical protein
MLLVLPVAVVLGAGAGGLEPSLRVLGPLSTFGLPIVAMIGFLWEDWPGTRLRPGWSGLLDTVLIVVGAVVFTFAGQLVVYGRIDLRGVFDPTPGATHAPTFPATLPLAAAVFVAMLQLALVSEGWPARRLGRLASGPAALVASWAIGVGFYLLLIQTHPKPGSGLRALSGPLSGAQLGALLVAVGVWQVWFYVVMRGWPFVRVTQRALRLFAANAVVIAAGVVTYTAFHRLGGSPSTFSSVGAPIVGAALLYGMLFDDWPLSAALSGRERLIALGIVVLVSIALYATLSAIAHEASWTTSKPEEWVSYAGNAIGAGVILHVAIGQRWPFAAA